MPDYNSRSDPYPYPTAAEVDAAPGDAVIKAARNIVTRKIDGIPRRAFLLGQNDHAPIVQSVAEFVGLVDQLLLAIPEADYNGSIREYGDKLAAMMLDNRCGDQVAPTLKVD